VRPWESSDWFHAMLAVLTGFLAGMVHVISGPDHLAAVAPLAVRAHRRSWLPGFRWGIGHSAGVAAVGLLTLLVRELLPLEKLSSLSERLVGVVLIGLGWWSLKVALRVQVHTHAHHHDGESHAHVHVHDPVHRHEAVEETSSHPGGHAHGHTAFCIGTLHGLAGSSHFLGVLPAVALPTRWEAGLYLGAFGLGTVAAMSGFSSLLGLIASRGALHASRTYRCLMGTCAFAAFGVGAWWLFAGG